MYSILYVIISFFRFIVIFFIELILFFVFNIMSFIFHFFSFSFVAIHLKTIFSSSTSLITSFIPSSLHVVAHFKNPSYLKEILQRLKSAPCLQFCFYTSMYLNPCN